MITERDWAQLESDWHTHGVTVRRVYPQSAHEIFIAVRHPDGARMLTIATDAHAMTDVLRQIHELPRTRGLEMQFARLGNDSGELRVILTDTSLREVFNPLASDIAATAHAEPSAADAVLAAVGRFDHWRQMLQNLAASGLDAVVRGEACSASWPSFATTSSRPCPPVRPSAHGPARRGLTKISSFPMPLSRLRPAWARNPRPSLSAASASWTTLGPGG